MNKCEVCGESFKSERGLHAHLKKHNLTVAEYYTQYYPKKDMLTGDPLPFKNKEDYFSKDFLTRARMHKWAASNPNKREVKDYILEKLKSRINKKSMSSAPCHLDIELTDMPSIDCYKHFFGSYGEACREIGFKPCYSSSMVQGFFEEDSVYDDIKILIDTREQKPLKFKNGEALKLDFGDYTAAGDFYSYTYIDRKSDTDFKSTLSVGFDRFKREIERAREFDSFLYIVVESSVSNINKNNLFAPHKANMAYIWHNTRLLIREYSDVCQVLFSGGRKSSEKLIPRLLRFGKNLWDCDVQYYIDKKIKENKEGK
tara:strand:- start:56 stop:997 length:942 start_codon:yes stop_codon:yes gene_type:complete